MQRRFYSMSELAYEKARHRFPPGEPLLFDESYRLAHLPLVAPDHPDLIPSKAGTDYCMGRYPTARYGLVVPVSWRDLFASPDFLALDQALKDASFGAKLNRHINDERLPNLHVTIAGGLAEAGIPASLRSITSVMEKAQFRYRLMGPLIGEKNLGRIYFPAVPEKLGDIDFFAELQAAVHRPQTGFYAMGYYHFTEELTPAEAQELSAIFREFQDAVIFEAETDRLGIIATNDDLTLSGRYVELRSF